MSHFSSLMRRGLPWAACLVSLSGCAFQAPAAPSLGAELATPDLGTEGSPAAAPHRVSLALQQDFAFASGSDVCTKQNQLEGRFSCFRTASAQYHGTPLPGEAGEVSGLLPATTRLLAGYDRRFAERFSLGVRGGLVLRGGGPTAAGGEAPDFFPLHAEGRAGLDLLEATAFAGATLRLGVFVAGGLAQVDASSAVDIREDSSAPRPMAHPKGDEEQTLEAYQKLGTGFVAGGATVSYAFPSFSAAYLGFKVMQLFPSSGTVLAPELGFEQGF